ncbi:hypothetical protein SKAU_G00269980 [Synaphobranchus kaupii]|uniref:Uncharacterized protein n=1 Tax=Synaphobranchus kaupii TaxID=118154 RepID=A0A9Q1F0D9_SYNKA|nr:hypothetical protein SKAU_G00269980 [Synaphobranchus kaupii]
MGAVRGGAAKNAQELQDTEGSVQAAGWKETDEEEEEYEGGRGKRRENCDSFSSTYERMVERAEQEEEEGKGAQKNQDRFSSTFEHMVEWELLRGECYRSLDSLDALVDETHSCASIRAPLTPLIQQRAMESWDGLSTVVVQEGVAVALEAESLEAGPEVAVEVRRPLRSAPGRPWQNSITNSQSENVLNQPLPRALPNGFYSDTHGSLGSSSMFPNSIRYDPFPPP